MARLHLHPIGRELEEHQSEPAREAMAPLEERLEEKRAVAGRNLQTRRGVRVFTRNRPPVFIVVAAGSEPHDKQQTEQSP